MSFSIFFSAFTFHNVSIKSLEHLRVKLSEIYFTFHNVSIKSDIYRRPAGNKRGFTFHNVSIKSEKWKANRQRRNKLYIPQCIY